MSHVKLKLITVIAIVLLLPLLECSEAAHIQKSFYDDLGVKYNATSDEIAASYQQQSQTWSTDKKYSPAEIEDIIEIQHAYHVLSNNLTRRDYDYFQFDALEADLVNIKKQYKTKTEPEYVEFPLWTPQKLGEIIESTAETVSSANFGELVLRSSHLWAIQIYSLASPECHGFAPVWNTTVNRLEGVVRVGMLELGEVPLTLLLAERNWLRGFPFFRNGLPAIITVHPGCQKLGCVTRYYGEKNPEAISDWVATRVLRLPRIPYYSAQSLVSDIIRKPVSHKVKVIQFSTTGERAPLYLRRAAKNYWEYAVFAMVLWRKSEAAFWDSRLGVEAGPATVFIKDPGLEPVVHHGELTAAEFTALIEKHKSFELPQLRSITAAGLGCDGSNHSLAGSETKIWYCVIVAGRLSYELSRLRGVLRDVQENMITDSREVTFLKPGVQAFRDKRLTLSWLDGEIQKDYCYFYLNSDTMFEACGPKRYELADIPKIFLIRFLKLNVEEVGTQKSRWLPKTVVEKEVEKESQYAAQLVTKYNGSADAEEIMNWISSMVTEGDSENLPYFRGKSPDLVAEEQIPFSAKAQEFVGEKRDGLLDKGKSFSHAVKDLKDDPKFIPLICLISFFYSAAFFVRARQKSAEAKKVAKEKVESDDRYQDSPDSTAAARGPSDAQSSEGTPLSAADGLRRREPFKSKS